MSHFVKHTLSDLSHGRETWRVFLTVGTPAFLIAVAYGLMLRH